MQKYMYFEENEEDGTVTLFTNLSGEVEKLIMPGSFDTLAYLIAEMGEKEAPENESNLVSHARRELQILGEEQETIDGYLKVIQEFANMGHSGGSASIAIPTITALLEYKNLRPLNDDPEQWMHIAEEVWGEEGGVWQSKRNPEAFSNDGGKTYYLLSECEDGVRFFRTSEPSRG